MLCMAVARHEGIKHAVGIAKTKVLTLAIRLSIIGFTHAVANGNLAENYEEPTIRTV